METSRYLPSSPHCQVGGEDGNWYGGNPLICAPHRGNHVLNSTSLRDTKWTALPLSPRRTWVYRGTKGEPTANTIGKKTRCKALVSPVWVHRGSPLITRRTGSPELRGHRAVSNKSSYVLREPASIPSPLFCSPGRPCGSPLRIRRQAWRSISSVGNPASMPVSQLKKTLLILNI